MEIKLAPSMMCSDYGHLADDLNQINNAGVDLLHCDIMDGHYVPNLIVGPDYIKTLRRLSNIRLDIHLMVEEPERFIDMFDLQPGERCCFHFETTRHPLRLLTQLKAMGIETGIALSPSVPETLIYDLLDEIDFIHLMFVNPGYAGQPLIPAMVSKLSRLDSYLRDNGIMKDIEVDGCVSYDNVTEFVEKGATTLVLGPYSCFDKAIGIEAAIEKVKTILKNNQKSA